MSNTDWSTTKMIFWSLSDSFVYLSFSEQCITCGGLWGTIHSFPSEFRIVEFTQLTHVDQYMSGFFHFINQVNELSSYGEVWRVLLATQEWEQKFPQANQDKEIGHLSLKRFNAMIEGHLKCNGIPNEGVFKNAWKRSIVVRIWAEMWRMSRIFSGMIRERTFHIRV